MTKAEVRQDIQLYWTSCDDMTVVNGIVLKGRRLVVSTFLQQQALEGFHSNHMGIEKTLY